MLTSLPSSRVAMSTGPTTTMATTIWAEVPSIWTMMTTLCLPMPRSNPRQRRSPEGSAPRMAQMPSQVATICLSPTLPACRVRRRIALEACRPSLNPPPRPARRRPSHRPALVEKGRYPRIPPLLRPRPVTFPRSPSQRSEAPSRRRRRRRRGPPPGRRGRSKPLPPRSRSAAPVPPPRARKSPPRPARGPAVGPNPRLRPSNRRRRSSPPPRPSLMTSLTSTTAKMTLMMPFQLRPRVTSALPVAVARSRSLPGSPRARARKPRRPQSPRVWASRSFRTRVAGPRPTGRYKCT
mmetsp:Transcript_21244/g.50124  ORF Transcript_21244/g.50124 Transcript_21244/m.50124 type:complete len:294 (+) Transcript_21244:2216-3097(+)